MVFISCPLTCLRPATITRCDSLLHLNTLPSPVVRSTPLLASRPWPVIASATRRRFLSSSQVIGNLSRRRPRAEKEKARKLRRLSLTETSVYLLSGSQEKSLTLDTSPLSNIPVSVYGVSVINLLSSSNACLLCLRLLFRSVSFSLLPWPTYAPFPSSPFSEKDRVVRKSVV